MPQKEIINTIKQLPLNERVELLEEISRSVSEELLQSDEVEDAEIYDNLTQADASRIVGMWRKKKAEAEEWRADAAPEQANESAQREQRLAAFHRLSGMLKTKEAPPTDQELKDDYLDYLEKKYS
jgi:Mg/Co/Ni transporter MgtE